MRRILALTSSAFLLAGCAVGPNYQRPQVPSPPQFRDTPAPGPESIADTKWFDLFHDEQLTGLVKKALAQNYDLQIASARVLEARAQLGITRAKGFPEVDGNLSFNAVKPTSDGATTFIKPGTNLDSSYTQGGFTLSWELDVWGRIRRLNEAARAQYLATEEARKGVITTLISDVTSNYFNLREADLEVSIAEKTKAIAENSLRLTTVRRTGGVATSLDVRQSEQLLYSATSQIAAAKRQTEQTENLLSLLVAQNPQAIQRGKELTAITNPPAVPAGLPSALLERRPDIRQAEQNLIAANANIGAAKAQYFPQITLTGLLGTQSRQLMNLFTANARNFNIAPGFTVPIFEAGRLRNGVRLTEAQQKEALAAYQKSVLTAFREVADALAARTRFAEQRQQQELLVKALADSQRLSTLRYKGGLDSYLQVLDAERNLFAGELALAKIRRDELIAVVDLYRSLGGGWQQ